MLRKTPRSSSPDALSRDSGISQVFFPFRRKFNNIPLSPLTSADTVNVRRAPVNFTSTGPQMDEVHFAADRSSSIGYSDTL